MIDKIKSLAATFLEYNMYNLFCSFLDEEKLNSARYLIEDHSVKLAEQLINSQQNGMTQVFSFQYSNLEKVDSLLTELVIQKEEIKKACEHDTR